MKFYYAIWRMILILPMPIKIFLEMLLLLLAAAIIWLAFRYILFLFSKVVSFLNHLFLGGIRYMLALFSRGNSNIYEWDERIGQRGQRIDEWLKKKGKRIRKKKYKEVLMNKWSFILLVIIYIAAILPCFHIDRFVSEYYLKDIYIINRIFDNWEKRLTQGMDEYPDLFKSQKEIEDNNEATEGMIVQTELTYLELKDDVAYANLRAEANIDGDSLCVVSREDQIVYQGVYEYDTKRYWLKVSIISQDNIEGWMSARVIREDIVDQLNLP